MRAFEHCDLEDAPLVLDAVYRGGSKGNISDEPLHRLLPSIGVQGGFRKKMVSTNRRLPAYVVIYTTLNELEWPDHLDVGTGAFTNYGDNREPGNHLHETHPGGNQLLKDVYGWLNQGRLELVPPFLIFKKEGTGRDVRFLGLAAPGNPNVTPDLELIAFWRSMNGERFQNYKAIFTVLDTHEDAISKEWLRARIDGDPDSVRYAPDCWRKFVEKGRMGMDPLSAPELNRAPNKQEQLPRDEDGRVVIKRIREHYSLNPFGFEKCSIELIRMMDSKFQNFELTRPWRDGGRDAIGHYRIGPDDHALSIDCALEAKCYGENNFVGVREMSRLISRIKLRQFGILVTTSHVDNQAYSEVVQDGHPILVITVRDIAEILRRNGIGIKEIDEWLKVVDNKPS